MVSKSMSFAFTTAVAGSSKYILEKCLKSALLEAGKKCWTVPLAVIFNHLQFYQLWSKRSPRRSQTCPPVQVKHHLSYEIQFVNTQVYSQLNYDSYISIKAQLFTDNPSPH